MGNPTRQLRAAIYDPYLDSLGGGERYCLTIAEILLREHYQVDLLWSGDPGLISQAQDFFSLDLTGLRCLPNVFSDRPQNLGPDQTPSSLFKTISHPSKVHHLVKRFQCLRQYDALFFLSDGSLPFLFAQKNLLHVQVPLHLQLTFTQKILNQIKLLLVKQVIFNSQFTASHSPYIPPSKSSVLYPPVDIDKFSPPETKENIILSVGRFDDILNIKRQDILIDAFKLLCQQYHPVGWKLVLAGGSIQDPKFNHYLAELQHQSRGFPIEFLVRPKFDLLQQVYAKAKIYWHAAGYQIEENLHPQLTEHFGITLVEAMAAGLVPLATNKGGQPEIIDHRVNGFLWDNQTVLVQTTAKLMNSPSLLASLSTQAIKKSQLFSKNTFKVNLLKILHSI